MGRKRGRGQSGEGERRECQHWQRGRHSSKPPFLVEDGQRLAQWPDDSPQHLNPAVAVGWERRGPIPEPMRKCNSQDLGGKQGGTSKARSGFWLGRWGGGGPVSLENSREKQVRAKTVSEFWLHVEFGGLWVSKGMSPTWVWSPSLGDLSAGHLGTGWKKDKTVGSLQSSIHRDGVGVGGQVSDGRAVGSLNEARLRDCVLGLGTVPCADLSRSHVSGRGLAWRE